MLSRKYHNTLYISGIIVIAFTVWSVIRNIIQMSISTEFVTMGEESLMDEHPAAMMDTV